MSATTQAAMPDAKPAPSAAAMPASAIANAVLTVERHLALDDPLWVDDDVHWWPLYRLELYRLLFVAHAAAPATTSAARPRLGPALRRARHAAGAAPAGVWLVSDGISFARVGDREVERFCDPLRSACRALGVPATVIDRGSEAPRAGVIAMHWLAPWTQRAKLAAALRARLAPDVRHDHRVAAIAAAAAAAGVALPALDARRFDAMARAVSRLAHTVEHRLRHERVRAIFVVGYYDVAGYAYVLAAARAGAPSIDIQHGVAGRYNLAYASWPRRTSGWRLLPRWFWTWTDSDAGVVNAWAGADGRHRALRGGHPFLEAWRCGALTLDASMRTRLDALLSGGGTRRRVLVTLQPHLAHGGALAPLLWAWRHCHDVTWWLRLHPMAHGDRDALVALLREHGTPHHDIDAATALPLPALLPHADLHATHSSSTVVEAEALGIASIVWSRYGAELAEDQVARGVVRIALDGPAFAHELARGGRIAVGAAADDATARALRTVLEMPE